jgi:tetratricopeptide (TPR) repeat protein
MKNFSTAARLVVSGLILCLPALGQAQNVKNIADREVARRQSRIPRGEEIVARAQSELSAKQYQLAHDDFRTALHYLPSSAASGTYSAALQGFCESGVKLAEQRIAEAKYEEAEQILNEILTDAYNPNCSEARSLMAHLHDPGYINKTMGPKFLAKVEEVKKLLTEAEGFYQSGRYDLAMKRYDQVLNLDPYNTAARKGQERIDLTKYQYGVQAYNETRGRAMWQVEHGWEQPVRQYGQTGGPIEGGIQRDAGNTARIRSKLDSIIIPRIEFRDASIREAIDFLRQQAAANDPIPEGRRGVDIVLRLHSFGRSNEPAPVTATTTAGETAALPAGENAPPAAAGVATTAAPLVTPATPSLPPVNPAESRITLTLNQIPLGEALRYIASQAGLKVKVEPYAVLILPLSEQSNELTTKEYRVPAGFISSTVNVGVSALNQGPTKVGVGAAGGTGKDTQESTGGQLLVNREGAREFLESQGVPFPPGASAHFLPQSSRLSYGIRSTIWNWSMRWWNKPASPVRNKSRSNRSLSRSPRIISRNSASTGCWGSSISVTTRFSVEAAQAEQLPVQECRQARRIGHSLLRVGRQLANFPLQRVIATALSPSVEMQSTHCLWGLPASAPPRRESLVFRECSPIRSSRLSFAR